jgi:hypothetical protein
MLIVDVSEVKLPGEQNINLPPECGQLIDGVYLWMDPKDETAFFLVN